MVSIGFKCADGCLSDACCTAFQSPASITEPPAACANVMAVLMYAVICAWVIHHVSPLGLIDCHSVQRHAVRHCDADVANIPLQGRRGLVLADKVALSPISMDCKKRASLGARGRLRGPRRLWVAASPSDGC